MDYMTPETRKLISKMAGSKGGTAAANAMTKVQRRERARKGGLARQSKARAGAARLSVL